MTPLAAEIPESLTERRLIEELEQIISPFTQAANVAVAYVSGRKAHWLTDCDECLCSSHEGTAPACLNQPPHAERPCQTIRLDQNSDQGGVLAICHRQDQSEMVAGMAAGIGTLIQSVTRRLEMEQDQELLLEELSASWESLEAIYEISSDLDLLHKPKETLDRIVNRAVSSREGLKAVLWIEREGLLHPLAKGVTAPNPRQSTRGLIEKVMSERNGIILNDRSRITAQTELEPEFHEATHLAVVPLTSRHSSVGALAVWREAGEGDFDSHDMRFLAALALQAAMIVENDRLHRTSLETERLRQEVEIGSKIQQTLLVGQVPGDFPGVKVAAMGIPSQMIDGDFYDFIKPHDSCLDVIIGDVMGKGIPAALVGAAAKTHFLRAISQLLSVPNRAYLPEPREIVAHVHAELVKQLIDLESFITLCYARFDLERKQMQLVDCGHTRTVRYRQRTKACDLLQGVNLPIGFSEYETYEQSSFELEDGDLFFFYSDGLTEARDAEGETFGEERLVEFITENTALDPDILVAEVHRRVIAFAGKDALGDDLTCVAVRIIDTALRRPLHRAKMELLSDVHRLEDCRTFAREICRQISSPLVDDVFISQIELVVSEVMTNVIRHAYNERVDQPIKFSVEVFADSITLQIRHRGVTFDPDDVPDPVFDGSKEGGFGLFIIAQLVEEVVYLVDEQGWNCISLVKKFKEGGQDGNQARND